MKHNRDKNLASYVRRIMVDKRISSYKVAKASGDAIEQSYVNRIKNGANTNPSPAKLRALAKGLGVSEEELFNVARGISPSGEDITHMRLRSINFAYDGMPKGKKRERVDYLIEMVDREIGRIIAERD